MRFHLDADRGQPVRAVSGDQGEGSSSEIPYNAVPDAVSRSASTTAATCGASVRVEEFAPADQYTLQGDLFARAVFEHTPLPVPLEDSVRNMAVIDAVFRAGESGRWEEPIA